jgi:micrococcal nuclease
MNNSSKRKRARDKRVKKKKDISRVVPGSYFNAMVKQTDIQFPFLQPQQFNMVWPFSSSSSSNKKSNDSDTPTGATVASALDTLELASEDTKAFLTSSKQHLEHDISTAETALKAAAKDLDLPPLPVPITIPASMEPYLIASAIFGVATTAVLFYRRNLRRIPSSAYLTPNMLKGKRVLKGKVTSVGDSDNFRFYHTPGGIWAGWGWLRHVPSGTKGNSDNRIDRSVVWRR